MNFVELCDAQLVASGELRVYLQSVDAKFWFVCGSGVPPFHHWSFLLLRFEHYCKKLRQRSVQKVSEKRKNSLIKLTLDGSSFYQGT